MMARPKATARRPNVTARPTESRSVHVKEKESFPDFLISYMHSLPAAPSEDASEAGAARPVKRPKLTTEGPEPIIIFQDELIITRPKNVSITSSSFDRQDVLHDMSLRLIPVVTLRRDDRSQVLVIAPRSEPDDGSFRVECLLKRQDLTKSLLAILEHVTWSYRNPGDAGAIWIAASIRYSRNRSNDTLSINFRVHWNASADINGVPQLSKLSSNARKHRDHILQCAFPDIFPSDINSQKDWSPLDFYEAAHVPPTESVESDGLQVLGLTASPYPFQRRAVQWLLSREGVRWSQDLRKIQPHEASSGVLPTSFFSAKDRNGDILYVSPVYSLATRDISPFWRLEQEVKGGILAEEMGLGKTVEIIALILLHERPATPSRVLDPYLGDRVTTTGATLIVAPTALKQQWVSEIQRHAPTLRLMVYSGIGKSGKDLESEEALVKELANHDIVVTTYSVLTAELDFAIPPPERARRAPRKYHRAKSPLVQLSWWRVCMDEAQMLESGVTKAATVARIIPRVNAWGITDLRGLLLFLRYEPYASSKQVWNSLIKSNKSVFRRLFNQVSMRHTKRMVRNEITIPPQKRYVITMPFTAIEEQHYQNLFKEMAEACGLNEQGEPLYGEWDPEDPAVLEGMRTALDRLRQTALHPEVGHRNRRALGHRNGPMRTVAEVLDAMIEQSDLALRTDQRALLSLQLTRGQLLENSPRVKEALAIWEEVLVASEGIVQECRHQLQKELDQASTTAEGANASSRDNADDDADETLSPRVGDATRRLRAALEILHKAIFFCANGYFQIKSNEDMTAPNSDDFNALEKQETQAYERAKRVRKEILQESHRKATRLMRRLTDLASNQAFVVIPEFRSIPYKGIESRAIVESLEMFSQVLNDQANQLDEWREGVIQLLLKPLVDEEGDNEITGDEYEDSTKLQEEIIVRIQVLRAAVSDRVDALSGTVNALVQHEAQYAIREAKDGNGPFPEKLLELYQTRDVVKPKPTLGSLRGVVSDLRALSVKLKNDEAGRSNRASVELEVVMKQLHWTQRQFTEQQKAATALQQEIDKFTSTENARTEYYRQLQAVSDMVALYEGPKDEGAMAFLAAEEDGIRKRLAIAEAKHRYLLHLKETDSRTDEQRICVICQSPFTVGVLTVCGHQFCKECIMLWFKANHNCPVCKRHLQQSNLHDITLKPQELKVHTEHTAGADDPHDHLQHSASKKSTIYSEFSSEKLAEIKDMELDGPAFTTKIDTLIRHLLWLRESDPGAKSIIFSQYHDFLNVLALAFTRYRIGYSSFDKPSGITNFKEDPSIECFLLHARAHASGLNLVNASHVFLCEPLLNTALELQAIARVHRIGQQEETTVWLYIVDGTVEESIYNMSVQRRMEHMGREDKGKSKESTPELLDVNLEAANSMELEQASLSKLMGKGRNAGEAVDKGDLWDCLFGNVARSKASQDQQLLENPAIRTFLAGEAAEERRQLQLVHGL